MHSGRRLQDCLLTELHLAHYLVSDRYQLMGLWIAMKTSQPNITIYGKDVHF